MDLSVNKQKSWISKLRKDPPAILRKRFQKTSASNISDEGGVSPSTMGKPISTSIFSPSLETEHSHESPKKQKLKNNSPSKHLANRSKKLKKRIHHMDKPPSSKIQEIDSNQNSRKDHIKRPMNAFMVWSKAERHRIIALHPTGHHSQISRLLGLRWSRMTPLERAPYNMEAERLKRLHLEQYPDYKYKPRKRNPNRLNGNKQTKKKKKYYKKDESPAAHADFKALSAMIKHESLLHDHKTGKAGLLVSGCPNVNLFGNSTNSLTPVSSGLKKMTLSALSQAQMQAGVEIFKPMQSKSNSVSHKPVSKKTNEIVLNSTGAFHTDLPLNIKTADSKTVPESKILETQDNSLAFENSDSNSSSLTFSSIFSSSSSSEVYPDVKIDIGDTPGFFSKCVDVVLADTAKEICSLSYHSGEKYLEMFDTMVDSLNLDTNLNDSDIKTSALDYQRLKNMQLKINYPDGDLPDLCDVLGENWNTEKFKFIN